MMRETVGGTATTRSEAELWHSLTLHKASVLLNIHRISILLALGLCLYLIEDLIFFNMIFQYFSLRLLIQYFQAFFDSAAKLSEQEQ